MLRIKNKFDFIFHQDLKNIKVVVGDCKYIGLELKKENFHNINGPNIKRVIFTDGGNAELFNNNSLSVQKLRVYSSVYENKKRLQSFREDLDAIAYTSIRNGEIIYTLETEPNKINLSLDSNDSSIRKGMNRAQISSMFDVARRFLEIKQSSDMCRKFHNSLIVLDGTLKPNYPGEKEILNELYKTAEENDCFVCAVAKTNNLITNKSLPVNYVLEKIAPFEKWYYYPIMQNKNSNHKAEIIMAKLNKSSKFIFRIEIAKHNMNNIGTIIATLKEFSSDFSFPGYPYGLIDADRFARISNDEKNILRLRFLHKLNKEVVNSENNTTAHDILNRIINR